MFAALQKVGAGLALAGAITGYLLVSNYAGATNCRPLSLGSLGLNCGLIEGLVYRFENFACLLGAAVAALPGVGLMLWAGARSRRAKSVDG